MSNSRDHELIKQCQRGDRRALEELLGHYQRPVYNAAYRMLGNPQDAADVTQAVFLKIFENLDRYNPKYRFFSWIYRIAMNESINLYNKGKRQQPLDEVQPSNEKGPEELTDASIQSDHIQDKLMGLGEDYRTVIVLRHFAEMKYQEISDVLHIPVVTVKSRLYTARQQLKNVLSREGI